jgi:hypothetical protein
MHAVVCMPWRGWTPTVPPWLPSVQTVNFNLNLGVAGYTSLSRCLLHLLVCMCIRAKPLQTISPWPLQNIRLVRLRCLALTGNCCSAAVALSADQVLPRWLSTLAEACDLCSERCTSLTFLGGGGGGLAQCPGGGEGGEGFSSNGPRQYPTP